MDRIIQGDALAVLKTLPDQSVECCVTSPPYFGLRDYGVAGQIGLEPTPEAYVASLVAVFREVRRVLWDDGTLWLNLGDSYASNTGDRAKVGGLQARPSAARAKAESAMSHKKRGEGIKFKDLIGIPWRVAFALQADGWYLRQDIIWHKPNPMPESVTDRCTKAHEYIFLLSKSERYYFDNEAIKEPYTEPLNRWGGANTKPTDQSKGDQFAVKERVERNRRPDPNGRNKRSVWTVTTKPYKGAHFATFPPNLIEPCILAGAPEGGTVLDPFFGSGTTGAVAKKLGCSYLGIELNPNYIRLAQRRINGVHVLQPKLLEAA